MKYHIKTGAIVPFIQKYHKSLIAAVAAIFLLSVASMTLNASAVVEDKNGCDFDVVGNTWTLQNNCSISSRLDIPDEVTVDGSGYTVSATFDRTSNSNNAAFGIIGSDNVTIENIIIDGSGGNTAWKFGLHGINTYKSANVDIKNVTITNMSYSGLIVNGSDVTVENITTSNNGWHAINVDQGSGVTETSELTVNGISSHNNELHIYSDHYASGGSVINDTNNQYSIIDNPVFPVNDPGYIDDRLYTLKDITPPTNLSAIFTKTPANVVVASGGYTDSQTFTFNLSADGDPVRYKLKYWNDIVGSPFKVASPWSPANLTPWSSSLGVYNDNFTQGEGVHYFSFSACDASDNCTTYSDPFVVTYDKTAPAQVLGLQNRQGHTSTSPLLGCNGYTNTTQIRIEWDASSESDLDYYWFGTRNNPYHKKVQAGTEFYNGNMTVNSNPEYFYTVIPVDNAGNEGPISVMCFVTLDQDNPDIEITSVSENPITGEFTIEGTASDNEGLRPLRISFRQITVSGVTSPVETLTTTVETDGTWSLTVNTLDYPALTDGDYRIVARANDLTGSSYGTSNTAADTEDVEIDNPGGTGVLGDSITVIKNIPIEQPPTNEGVVLAANTENTGVLGDSTGTLSDTGASYVAYALVATVLTVTTATLAVVTVRKPGE